MMDFPWELGKMKIQQGKCLHGKLREVQVREYTAKVSAVIPTFFICVDNPLKLTLKKKM